MISSLSRGFSDNCLTQEKIFDKMNALMAKASVPVLTNIELLIDGRQAKGETHTHMTAEAFVVLCSPPSPSLSPCLPGLQECEIYPMPIPDLFMGAPLVCDTYTLDTPPSLRTAF